MSKSERNEQRNYDDFDRGYESGTNLYIQISLPSTRIEVQPNHILFKKTGGSIEEIAAKHIQKNDLLFVKRDDKQVTEMVFETEQVYRKVLGSSNSSRTQTGIIIVNNVYMKPN